MLSCDCRPDEIAEAATGKRCTACLTDMRGKWAGAKLGKRKLCLRCNESGYYLTATGFAR